MSDSPALGFALGYLAAGPATETATTGALMLTRALRGRQEPQIDVNGLLYQLQEQEQYIARQDDLIAQLRAINVEWQQYGAELKAQKAELREWANWAEQKLKDVENKG